jgi:hypothetical protein
VISLLETAEWWMFHAAADRAVLYVMWVTPLLTATACHILMLDKFRACRATFDKILDMSFFAKQAASSTRPQQHADCGRPYARWLACACRAQQGPGELKRGKWLACGVVVECLAIGDPRSGSGMKPCPRSSLSVATGPRVEGRVAAFCETPRSALKQMSLRLKPTAAASLQLPLCLWNLPRPIKHCRGSVMFR